MDFFMFSPIRGNFSSMAPHAAHLRSGTKMGGLELIDKGIARHGYPVTDAAGNPIGQVTSGTMSPSLKKAIAMAYVPAELSAPGSEVYVEVRGKLLRARVVRMPFE